MTGTAAKPIYESLFNRVVASAIDNGVALFAVVIVLGLVPTDASDDVYAGLAVVLATLWFNYFAFSEWRWGRTLGKHAMGMKVTRLDGSEPGFGPASIRNVMRIIDFFFVGPILIASTDRNQRLGDLTAGTVVVRDRPFGSARPATAKTKPASVPAAGAGGFPWVTWTARRTVSGLFAGLGLGILIVPLVVLPFDPDLESTGATLVAQALLGATLIGTSLYIAKGEGEFKLREALSRLGWQRFGPKAIGIALLTMFAYYIAVAVFAALVIEPDQEDIARELGLDEGALAAAAVIFLIAVVAPISEETFFRGFLFGGLRSKLSLWPAALISGLIFGGIHAPTGITAVVPLALLGVALAWLYDRTGSIGPCILAHMVNNSLALAVAS